MLNVCSPNHFGELTEAHGGGSHSSTTLRAVSFSGPATSRACPKAARPKGSCCRRCWSFGSLVAKRGPTADHSNANSSTSAKRAQAASRPTSPNGQPSRRVAWGDASLLPNGHSALACARAAAPVRHQGADERHAAVHGAAPPKSRSAAPSSTPRSPCRRPEPSLTAKN
jgi:hypothetical protein